MSADDEGFVVVAGIVIGGTVEVLSVETVSDGKRNYKLARCLCRVCGEVFARKATELKAAKMAARRITCKKCSKRGPFYQGNTARFKRKAL